jgi:hypothetical protein
MAGRSIHIGVMTLPRPHIQPASSPPVPTELPQARWLAAVGPSDAAARAPEPHDQPRSAPAGPGPLVAVCGLCGGAGASTLAYLIARSTAIGALEEGPPVLALDAGGTTGGLSLYSRAASGRSLAELAEDIRLGRPTSTPMFTTAVDGVRLIATPPRAQPEPEPKPLVISRILSDAREAHRMTVVDCGTLSLPTERLALELATHVTWVMPATEDGLRRAQLSPSTVVSCAPTQILVARHDPSGRKASIRALAELANERHSALVLMPQVADLGGKSTDDALEICSVTMEVLALKLRQ